MAESDKEANEQDKSQHPAKSDPPVPESSGEELANAEDVPEELRPLLLTIEPDKRRVITEYIIEASSGPLPPPGMLMRYEQIIPGIGNRLLTMAEKNQDHRHKMESIIMPARAWYARRGQWLGAAVLFALLAFAGWLVTVGQVWLASLVLTTTLVVAIQANVRVFGNITKKDAPKKDASK